MDKISWEAPLHIYKEKNADWYWIVGIVTISIAIVAIILNNVIFAILILVSSFTLSLLASRKPDVVRMEINNTGIVVGNTQYPFAHLESFWVETREVYPKIILKSKKMLMPFITVLLLDADQNNAREKLLQHLPEVEHTEPFLEKLLIYLGF